ncbi:MAG: hypothetical protein HY231_08785 [Acidobacteria bacterium]|nr:hypothetical protein [Acidobacteriota bacterium]
MQIKYLGSALMVGLMVWATATAQTYTPKAGSAERKALMDALRVPVEKALGKKVVFKVEHLQAQNGWAFMTGALKQPNGAAMDFRGTPFYRTYKDGMFSDFVCGLFRKKGDKWQVVNHCLGSTDVPYVDWSQRYQAPAAIFP